MTKDEMERRAPEWYFKVRDEFPLWKRWTWRIFGKKREGWDSGYHVIGYELRGITYVWVMEGDQP